MVSNCVYRCKHGYAKRARTFAKLVGGLLRSNSVDSEAPFNIIQDPKVLSTFFDCNDILESAWVVSVCPNFSIDFNEPLSDDCNDFSTSESVFKATAEEDGERKRFTQFVWTRGRAWSLLGTRVVN